MTQKLRNILEEADELSPDEQLVLMAHLAERRSESSKPPTWKEMRGRAASPLAGEDAQTWVSRSRATDRRERA